MFCNVYTVWFGTMVWLINYHPPGMDSSFRWEVINDEAKLLSSLLWVRLLLHLWLLSGYLIKKIYKPKDKCRYLLFSWIHREPLLQHHLLHTDIGSCQVKHGEIFLCLPTHTFNYWNVYNCLYTYSLRFLILGGWTSDEQKIWLYTVMDRLSQNAALDMVED